MLTPPRTDARGARDSEIMAAARAYDVSDNAEDVEGSELARHITDLPAELLLAILLRLDDGEIHFAARCCHLLRTSALVAIEQLKQRASTTQILERVTQLWPEVAPQPAGFVVPLPDYHRRCLAFMMSVERGDHGSAGRWHDESYSDEERRHRVSMPPVRSWPVTGGWLANPIGANKNAICFALIAANNSPHPQLPQADATEGTTPPDVPVLKLTVVCTNNTLVSTWQTEAESLVPGVRCAQYYAASKKAETLKRLANDELDLLITSHHTRLPPELQQPLRVHRLIIDESEWFEPGPYSKYKDIGLIRQRFRPSHIWCVSESPSEILKVSLGDRRENDRIYRTISLKNLINQARILGQYRDGLKLRDVIGELDSKGNPARSSSYSETSDDEIVARLRKVMLNQGRYYSESYWRAHGGSGT